MCVIKAAMFKNTNGIQVTLSVVCSLNCLVNAYAETRKKHKEDPSVEMIVSGRFPVQWTSDTAIIPPISWASPRINVDV